MVYTIGILRHDKIGHAEERIIENCKKRKLQYVVIDPFNVTIGIEPELVTNHGSELKLDGIISRCEISSALAPEAEAYLRLLQFYENRGVPVINSSQSIVTCQDKFRTHYTLAQKGLPTPKTFITYNYKDAKRIMNDFNLEFPVMIKDIYGSRGSGVHKMESLKEMKELYGTNFSPDSAFILQEFLELDRNEEGEVRDLRLWVVRDKLTENSKTIGAVYRNARGGEFRTNAYHSGYVSKIEDFDEEIARIGELALNAVNADVAGVDIAVTKDHKMYLEEINISFDTGPISQGIIGEDIWGDVVDLLISRIEHKKNLYS